jgi:radical SAM superfamily enzyme YgiQ (UPF0313 family)
MRNVINKGITEDDILFAAETLVANGIPNVKLYFMVGLPTETDSDVDAIISLCKKIKQIFLKTSRLRKRMGLITVSISAFVPKPFTPFQWVAMDEVGVLNMKIKKIKAGLKRISNVRIHADVPRRSYLQALFSRGDRKVADLLSWAHDNRANWNAAVKHAPFDPDFHVHRVRALDELLPWDFIDHGIHKSFLAQEFKKAQINRLSPPCQMESCNLCGVCKDN